jgi:ELWxxDGT repeat protein
MRLAASVSGVGLLASPLSLRDPSHLLAAPALSAELVADIEPGPGSAGPYNGYPSGGGFEDYRSANVHGRLIFSAQRTSGPNPTGRELWSSNGTAAGTRLIRDINPGPASSNPSFLYGFDGGVIFSAFHPDSGVELWSTDGTEEGTRRVMDIEPGKASSDPQEFVAATAYDSHGEAIPVVYFRATDRDHRSQLWRSDGTEGGTVRVTSFDPRVEPRPYGMFPLGRLLLFWAYEGQRYKLWSYDPLIESTALVADDIQGDAPAARAHGPLFFKAGDRAVFRAWDLTRGTELWATDGTAAGTMPLTETLVPGLGDWEMTNVNEALYFSGRWSTALGEVRSGLWKTDGTVAGTMLVYEPPATGIRLGGFHTVFDTLFFGAAVRVESPSPNESWVVGALLKSDGTAAGTSILREFDPRAFYQWRVLAAADGVLLLEVQSRNADLTPGPPELWASDGTAAGTLKIAEFPRIGVVDPYIRMLQSTGTTFYFTVNDGPAGWELWKVDLPDADKDGLLDEWETTGIDYDLDGVIDWTFGDANRDHKDLYLEIDAMSGFAPTQQVINDVVAAFAGAPVTNPDRREGITLHVRLDETNLAVARWPDDWRDFDSVKRAHFTGSAGPFRVLRLFYRYAVFADMSSDDARSGLAELPGNDLMVTFGGWSGIHIASNGGREAVEAAALMHELGHTLGLRHGGGDHVNYKPNYLSVMNYTFQFQRVVPTRPLDYSRWALFPSRAPLDEFNLDERRGIDNGAPPPDLARRWPFTAYTYFDAANTQCSYETAATVGPIDWNRENGIEPDVFARLNDPDPDDGITPDGDACRGLSFQTLAGFDDWSHLVYNFRGSPDSADGAHFTARQQEMTSHDAARLARLSDFDRDGVSNFDDNCVATQNADQADHDGHGVGDACDVQNLPPVCVSEVQTLAGPANLAMVGVAITGASDPEGDALTIAIDVVFQDEPASMWGADPTPDATRAPLAVRNQRGNPANAGNGRYYLIRYTATDPAGGSCQGTKTVIVPGRGVPVNNGTTFSSMP